jgi:Sec-independent protein secretion pathway component TatC
LHDFHLQIQQMHNILNNHLKHKQINIGPVKEKIVFYKNIKEIKLKLYYNILSIILTFIVCYIYINQIIFILIKYLLYNMESHRFIFTKFTEVFYTYIRISLISSILICFPFILFNI